MRQLLSPTTRPILAPLLLERSRDPAWEVRRQAVDSLCSLANSDLRHCEDSVLASVRERTLDKRAEVRKYAVTGLVNVGMTGVSLLDGGDPLLSLLEPERNAAALAGGEIGKCSVGVVPLLRGGERRDAQSLRATGQRDAGGLLR